MKAMYEAFKALAYAIDPDWDLVLIPVDTPTRIDWDRVMDARSEWPVEM